MHQSEKEFTHDNGFKSRKFLLSVGTIALLAVVGLIYSHYGWGMEVYSTMATSVVAVALGYMGIKAGRDAVPRAASRIREGREVEEKPESGDTHDNTLDEEQV